MAEGASTTRAAPAARRRPQTRELHGEKSLDDYAWLADRESDEVVAHLEAENRYTEQSLAHTEALRERLFQEIKARVKESDLSVPARKGPWWYVTRTREGEQYEIFARRRGEPNGEEEVLLDCNQLAEASPYFALGALEVSPDHRLLAYSTDTSGAEKYTLHFRDLETGRDLADEIPDTYYGAAFSADSGFFFYTKPDETMRPHEVWRHRIGAPPESDVRVFAEPDERFSLEVEACRSEAFVFITAESKTTCEVWALDAHTPLEEFSCLRPRESGVEYWADARADHFVVLSNLDAKDGALHRAPLDKPDEWSAILAHEPGVKLDGFDVFAEHIVVWCRRGGYGAITILPDEGEAFDLELPEVVRSVEEEENLEYETKQLRFSYESLVTPSSTYEIDLETRATRLLKREPVLGGFDPEDFASSQLLAEAEDGTRVPISLVHHKETPLDGSAPCLLYGYGAYESSSDPWFSISRLSLLERGVVFAIAHVRGGGELGRGWYEQGKLAHKHHSFSDFIACAQQLIHERICDPGRLAARGASAGGLLVGGALNMRPELFAAVVAEVPFVDVVNTMLDPDLPLTATEWEEWGDPRIAEQCRWMRAYAPYENIRKVAYPPLLVTAGLNDPRVQFWEPAKWVARLRAESTGTAPILLKTEMGAGHGGPSGRYDSWRDEAFVLAFLLDALGVQGPSE